MLTRTELPRVKKFRRFRGALKGEFCSSYKFWRENYWKGGKEVATGHLQSTRGFFRGRWHKYIQHEPQIDSAQWIYFKSGLAYFLFNIFFNIFSYLCIVAHRICSVITATSYMGVCTCLSVCLSACLSGNFNLDSVDATITILGGYNVNHDMHIK